ncbi:MAG TPA: CvpA family protein [Puia sp.]|nr:CvpA family protein [Puia sp.]
MIVDILFLIFLLGAIIKGLRRGLIVAVFSLLALIIGLAAAIKLSAVVAMHLKDSGVRVSSKWLPILSFVIVFLIVVFLVRWFEKLLESIIKFTLLTWVDKLGGVVLYVVVYLAVFSVILFYLTKAHVLSDGVIASSKTYNFIEPYGPYIINKVANLFPVFKDMFAQLEDFFGSVAR